MEPRIQYAKTSDGVNIAYAVSGEGTPLVIAPAKPFSHVVLGYEWGRELWNELEQQFRVLRYDVRGSGMSDRSAVDFSLEAAQRDLEAVVDAAAFSRFILNASWDNVPPAISYAVAHPERLLLLILQNGWAKFGDYQEGPALAVEQALRDKDWVLTSDTIAFLIGGIFNLTGEAIRECVDAGAYRVSQAALESYDVTDLLPQVQAPTIVVHGRENRWLPLSAAQRVAASIPKAQLQVVDGQNWRDWIRELAPDQHRRDVGPVPSGTAIILFADIADSTALTEQLGDAAFREKARELDEALRRAISSNGGTAIDGKLLGDGVLATFGAAREAIACAAAIHRMAGSRVEGRGSSPDALLLHIGIHAGDVIRESNNVYGGAVNIAARVASEAAAGETLVSATVRDLARTSAGVSFEDRGERELKGVGEPVRLFAVRSKVEPPFPRRPALERSEGEGARG